MDSDTWALLLKQLDRIEKQNDDQLSLLHKHLDDDEKVHKVVERHSVYFSILGLGIPSLVALLAKKFGIK